MKPQPIQALLDGARHFTPAKNVPADIAASLAEAFHEGRLASDYGEDFTEYFIPTGFRVYFSSCDGSFSKRVSTLAAAAAKVREYIGKADEDFGYVADDGVCRCTGVSAIVKGASRHSVREISLSYLLANF